MAHSPDHYDHYDHIGEDGVTRIPVTYARTVVHACPEGDSGFTPCCDRTPFGLPPFDRMTVDPDLVTCKRSTT